MRVGRLNKQELYYALQGAEVPIYDKNPDGSIKYISVDGVMVPVETGETEIGYFDPVKFFANISTSGESETNEYGLSVSDYDAVFVLPRNAVPLTETSLIWLKGNVGYKDTDKMMIDPNTADYRVTAVKPSLNAIKYVLKRITK